MKTTSHIKREHLRQVGKARRKGQAIVEAALVIPLILAVLIGIIEFGWLVKNSHTIANASREGARFAALGRTAADVRTRVRSAAAPITVTDANIALQHYDTSTNTWGSWSADGASTNNVPVSSQIKVTVRAPHQQLTGFFPFLRNRIIEQFTVMRREL